ncbi:hypothetical protein CLV90_3277 [Maribacter spongiicola]|uniref:Uncharacterized protein n=1 Tax=Maribacter spongiicola TaxID=1206753 RepID=A0A4R7JQK4_9FLAO|nr:DUF6327 family protein [Maribacter spongiicola]TDT40430.1 hypothetical protein CLV90_3277 [Maribacter spongiicola]
MSKQYHSFEEIDERLKVLNLQRLIAQESIKLQFNSTKTDLVPQQLRQGLGATFSQKGTIKSLVITFLSSKLLDFIKSKRKSRNRDLS